MHAFVSHLRDMVDSGAIDGEASVMIDGFDEASIIDSQLDR